MLIVALLYRRKVRESIKAYLDEPHVLSYLNIFKEGMWPGGHLKPQSPPRSAEEKARTREEANRKLSTLLPGVLINCGLNAIFMLMFPQT